MDSLTDGDITHSGIIKILASSFRNYSLYPEGHSLSLNSIKHITSEMIKFTDHSGDLLLRIDKDGIYCDSKKKYSCTGDDDAFVYPLVRDGILNLEFLKGIQKSEIVTLFNIIKKNRQLPDDPESDTVTDLWQAELPHLRYQASEVFSDSESVFTFPKPSIDFPESPSPRPSVINDLNNKRKDGAFHPGPGGLSYEPSFFEPANLNGPYFAGIDLSFNPDELVQLRHMVTEEEENHGEEDILDLLLLVLDGISSSEDLENVLINLAEEFLRVLQKSETYKAFSVIEKVTAYHNKHAWMRPFVDTKVNHFMAHLAGSVFKEALTGIVDILNQNKPEDIFFFKKICMTLDSSLVLSLCEILLYLENQTSRDLLMEIIKQKTRDDVGVIEQMLDSKDTMTVLIGISILKSMKNNNSEILLQRMLNHSVEQIRSITLDYFIEKPVSILPRIFFLIDDSSLDIKIKLLRFIGSRRALVSESLMMNYLDDQLMNTNDTEHLLSCYKILGKCGSDRSILFLKNKIFGGSWMGLSSKSFEHRAGAIMALAELESIEAMKLLKKASKSLRPVVRKAYKMFMD